jgi:hypothetical protein
LAVEASMDATAANVGPWTTRYARGMPDESMCACGKPLVCHVCEACEKPYNVGDTDECWRAD